MGPEAALQSACVGLLNTYEAQGKLTYFHVPNGAWLAGNPVQRARIVSAMKKQGVRPGVPDLVILLRNRVAFAELKAGRGKLSENQEAWRDSIRVLEHDWREIRSVEDMKSYVEELTGE